MNKKNVKSFPEPPLTEEQAQTMDLVPQKTTDLRADMLQVFSNLGGVQDMTNWVKESTANKRIFYSQILPRMIPKETKITGNDGGPVKMVVEWAGGPPPEAIVIPATVVDNE